MYKPCIDQNHCKRLSVINISLQNLIILIRYIASLRMKNYKSWYYFVGDITIVSQVLHPLLYTGTVCWHFFVNTQTALYAQRHLKADPINIKQWYKSMMCISVWCHWCLKSLWCSTGIITTRLIYTTGSQYRGFPYMRTLWPNWIYLQQWQRHCFRTLWRW